MTYQLNQATSVALLGTRIVVAGIFLWHGIPKAVNWDVAMAKFVGFGLPSILGPLTGIIEVVAAALLLAGVLSRLSAMALSIVIFGAIVTVQLPAGVTAGLERDVLILAATLLLWATGPGRLTLGALSNERLRNRDV